MTVVHFLACLGISYQRSGEVFTSLVAMSNPLEGSVFLYDVCNIEILYEVNFVNWYLCVVYAGEIHGTVILFSDEAWCYLSGYMTFWKNGY
jgi:hypothetical protein